MSNNDKVRKKNGDVAPPSRDEQPSPFVQEGVPQRKLCSAKVKHLNGTTSTYHISKKAYGDVLIDMVFNQLQLNERDYFGLSFYDHQNNLQHWLYKERRISTQLKSLSWEFSFKVKFYPTNPSQLVEDLARHLLYLQLRRDILKTRLPASFAAQAKLGSLVAQAEFGNFDSIQTNEDYNNNLTNENIAQSVPGQEFFVEKVKELHISNRGMNACEAEQTYLNECKDLSMYGVRQFPAKDNKGKLISIGVCSQGINIYRDQMLVHHFIWARISKISYRRSTFSIKLMPGEIDSKAKTESYKLNGYHLAKILWKCGVENHGFFRLIQPERPKSSFFNFGSKRFHFQGRTNIQSQMTSQLFENPPSVERIPASKSAEPMLERNNRSPLRFADESCGTPMIVAGARAAPIKEIPSKKDHQEYVVNEQKIVTGTSSSSASTGDVDKVYVINDDMQECSLPHTTVQTWKDTTIGPEVVTTETDEHGNVIKRIVRTEQVKHTVQKQTYQTYSVDEGDPHNFESPGKTEIPSPKLFDANQKNNGVLDSNNNELDSDLGELVSRKAITTGNRTIETLTFKKEKNGVLETHVEHRITVHGEMENNDEELNQAIIGAINLDPTNKVEKVGI